jgi:hypothetical protein
LEKETEDQYEVNATLQKSLVVPSNPVISSGFEHEILFFPKKHEGSIVFLKFPELSKFGVICWPSLFWPKPSLKPQKIFVSN